MIFADEGPDYGGSRAAVAAAYRADESAVLDTLIEAARPTPEERLRTETLAQRLVRAVRDERRAADRELADVEQERGVRGAWPNYFTKINSARHRARKNVKCTTVTAAHAAVPGGVRGRRGAGRRVRCLRPRVTECSRWGAAARRRACAR